MNKQATVTFTTQEVDQPQGVVVGGFAVSLLLAGALVGEPMVVTDQRAPIAFTISQPGEYAVGVCRVAQSGEPCSATVMSDPFIVAVDKMSVPLVVTISIGDVPRIDVPVAVDVVV